MAINFIHEGASKRDVLDYFDDISDEKCVKILDTDRLEHLMVDHLHKFPSLSQARRNGFGGEIPKGFIKWRCGKTHFWTFKPFGDLSEWFNGEELEAQKKEHEELFWT